ncbi:MAG: cysteine hydrolase, partial [SAR324 cluster bacterium]|nr:cysteine hydrolase [SAR324 cluster bacterium]
MPDRRPLTFGFLDEQALHICIDMQQIFLEPGPWYAEAGLAILPKIEQLVHARNLPTFFTR